MKPIGLVVKVVSYQDQASEVPDFTPKCSQLASHFVGITCDDHLVEEVVKCQFVIGLIWTAFPEVQGVTATSQFDDVFDATTHRIDSCSGQGLLGGVGDIDVSGNTPVGRVGFEPPFPTAGRVGVPVIFQHVGADHVVADRRESPGGRFSESNRIAGDAGGEDGGVRSLQRVMDTGQTHVRVEVVGQLNGPEISVDLVRWRAGPHLQNHVD